MSNVPVEGDRNAVTVQQIYCPNCGGDAERRYFSDSALLQVQCPHCDYFMVTCASTGRVREAYAPGIPVHR